jgi:putative acetyltransferase
MLIREENERDWPAVFSINQAAFPTVAEANLVNTLRAQCSPIISLVAEESETVIGHILFSPVQLSGHPQLFLMGLAPMAVLPEQQGKGIGSALIKAGLEKCRGLRVGAVVLLGHVAYYPRFGFVPSVRYGIRCEYKAPEDAFMVLELQAGYLSGKTGVIHYHDAFKNV